MDSDHRCQIESRLGRELTTEELVEVPTFEDLGRAQLDVVQRLAARDGILASMYVRGVIPIADYGDVRESVLNIDAFIANRFPVPAPAKLRMEPLYARELGRPLADNERVPVESLQSLSQAHLALATQLALKEPANAAIYLGEVVTSSAVYDRQLFAEQLKSRK